MHGETVKYESVAYIIWPPSNHSSMEKIDN